MSRKRNSKKGGKKARLYGSSSGKGGGLGKHRTSGRARVNRGYLIRACEDQNRASAKRRREKLRRTKMHARVTDLMADRAKR